MSKQVSHVSIPTDSALSSHTRFGVDGGCAQCGESIAAHLGRNTWLGCPSATVPVEAPLVLIIGRRASDSPHPLRRAVDNGAVPSPSRRASDNGHMPARTVQRPTPPPPAAQSQTAPAFSWTKYRALAGVRDPKVKKLASERDREVFAAIARAKSGITRLDLLKAMKATTRTGIVDGAVRRLRIRYKLVESVSI